jgi:hypothetical protein
MAPLFNPLYIVLVTGDRHWDDMRTVEADAAMLLKQNLKSDLIIIHGGAPGLDTIWDIVANKNSIHRAKVDALWETRYRGAGPQRNSVMGRLIFQAMLGSILSEYPTQDVEEEAHVEFGQCLAYHNDIRKSKGTRNMVKWAVRHGIPVFPRGFKLKDVT